MSEFGERLRETRESLGISLEEVEAETKIRKLYIEALEKENFSILPPQVYATGFVKRYAKMLKLDADALSSEFKQLAYPEAEEEIPVQPEKKIQLDIDFSRFPVKNIILALVFLGLAIWAGSLFADYLGNHVEKQQPTPPKVENKQPGSTTQPNQVNQPSQSDQSNQGETEKLTMKIKVKPGLNCWTRVRVDGQNKLETTLAGGQEESFTADESIYIRLGNAGAVDIYINGKAVEPLGEINQVAEKEFKKSDNNQAQ